MKRRTPPDPPSLVLIVFAGIWIAAAVALMVLEPVLS